MQGSAAELDFMLKDAGQPVVFARAGKTLATTNGLFERKPLLGQGPGGYEDMGIDTTLAIRDGTQGTLTLEDTATIGGVSYKVRDLGVVQADGLRLLTLA